MGSGRAWSVLKGYWVPSCVREVLDGTAHNVHSKPKAFWLLGLQNGEQSGNSEFTGSIRHGMGGGNEPLIPGDASLPASGRAAATSTVGHRLGHRQAPETHN